MPHRRPSRILSLVLALGLLNACQVFPGMTGPQSEGTVIYSTGKLLLGSRFVGLQSADGKPVGEISVQVGGKIYKSKNGKLLLPEYAVREAQAEGLVVLVPGYLPRKVRMDEAEAITLTPVYSPKVHPGVGAEGGSFPSGDGTATVMLPPGFLKAPPTSLAVSTYAPPIEAHHQAAFDQARAAFLAELGLSTACDQPLPCGPLAHALGLLVTIDGPIHPGKLPITFDLAAMGRGWSGEGAGPWEAAPADWTAFQIQQAKAAAAIAKALAALEAPAYAGARAALESRFGIAWSGRTLTFTVTLGDSQIIDGLARVEVEGFDLLGARLEVTVVSAVAESLPPAASQPGLSSGPASGPSGSGGAGIIASGGGNVISTGGGNVISTGGGNVISTGGGNIIAAGGGNVIATGGGNVIATGGGNVIAAGGGNLLEQAGNFVNAGGSFTGTVRMPEAPLIAKYGLLAFSDFPWPNAEVRLVDVEGAPLTEWQMADGAGVYTLTNLPQTPQGVFIEAKGGAHLVRTFAPAPGGATITADLDAATTSVTGYLLEELKSGVVASVDMEKFAQDVADVRAAMSQQQAEQVTAVAAPPLVSATLVRTLQVAGTVTIRSLATPTVSTPSLAGTILGQPKGVAVDSAGNVYVADSNHHVILKIKPSGSVTTLAGNGQQGQTDGPARSARFNKPAGLAIDGSGNLYVADKFNSRIRKIDPNGNVTTYAGSMQGHADGPGTTARFDSPEGLAIDGAGNIFVTDEAQHAIRKIDPAGNVTTVTGPRAAGHVDGNVLTARFNQPTGVAVDASGNLYVADSGNGAIRKIDTNGDVTTIADSTAPVTRVPRPTLRKPWAIVIDRANYLYVADAGSHCLFVLNASGTKATLAGTGATGTADGTGTSATFSGPKGLAIGANGTFFVGDTANNLLRKLVVPAGWVTNTLAPPLVGTPSLSINPDVLPSPPISIDI